MRKLKIREKEKKNDSKKIKDFTYVNILVKYCDKVFCFLNIIVIISYDTVVINFIVGFLKVKKNKKQLCTL